MRFEHDEPEGELVFEVLGDGTIAGPDHAVLGKIVGATIVDPAGARLLWVTDDRTVVFANGVQGLRRALATTATDLAARPIQTRRACVQAGERLGDVHARQATGAGVTSRLRRPRPRASPRSTGREARRRARCTGARGSREHRSG